MSTFRLDSERAEGTMELSLQEGLFTRATEKVWLGPSNLDSLRPWIVSGIELVEPPDAHSNFYDDGPTIQLIVGVFTKLSVALTALREPRHLVTPFPTRIFCPARQCFGVMATRPTKPFRVRLHWEHVGVKEPAR